MSIAGSQARTFLRLARQLRPRWRDDPGLPARIQTLLAGERAFGSRDRRLYRELLYTTLRYLPWVEPVLDANPDEAVRRVAWLAAEGPATRAFRAAFALGDPPAGDAADLLPAWFRPHCPELFVPPEPEVQLRRPPLWLRLQSDDPAEVTTEFAMRGWACRPSALLPSALEVLAEVDVTTTAAYERGRCEVQDLGSQLLLETVGIEPGGRWLDACAGAGGKSLQLSRLLGPAGRVDAHDIRRAALDELRRRAKRAHASNIRIVASPEGAVYDGVLVDAPCSGSGTWRRAPHLKWTTTEPLVAEHAARQCRLLADFARSVRPGGRLVYATCSLSRQENEAVVAAFRRDHPDFHPAPPARTFQALPRGDGLLILPGLHNSDGFYVASLRRD